MTLLPRTSRLIALATMALFVSASLAAQHTQKPVLHGKHWVAVTGKPLGAAAGAMTFFRGGNAVDAACGMLAAVTTMWDVLSWGGETQALIYNPHTKKVIGINALGVAPSGASREFFKSRKLNYPPATGALAAVTPGTPGGLITMLAEYGTMSLKDVLAPAIQMADGYPMEDETANSIERNKTLIKRWKYSRSLFLTHPGEAREAPQTGELFRQPDLAATLRKLVETEQQALGQGKSRKEAIYAAYDRFYKGDIAREFVRATQEEGGLITLQDLADWKVLIEEPLSVNYRGVDVFKLQQWTQGPALLQALNILENADLKAMGYNSSAYIHTLYQAMNLAFADRDFYYGDPAFAKVAQPMQGLLSKAYAKARYAAMNRTKNDATAKPGDPYPFQGGTNPFRKYLDAWKTENGRQDAAMDVVPSHDASGAASASGDAATSGSALGVLEWATGDDAFHRDFTAGTTSIQAADEEGWVISVTPSGGWVPAVIAGRTGIGLSQRMQAFVLDSAEGPWAVLEPGKRPRVTLTPTLALKQGAPIMAFSVQGGDSQDQNLLQFFINMVDFGMTVQQAVEAPNINSYQMRSTFGQHGTRVGRMLVNSSLGSRVQGDLKAMGYTLEVNTFTSGPLTAIWLDHAHGTMWGGASNYGQDYGIAW